MGCTVNNFLCCISLETGGLIIGWINLILSAIVILISITTMILLAVGFDAVENSNDFAGGFIAFMILFSILMIYYVIVFMASLMLIQAVRRREHTRMVLFMIIMAIGVILQFIQLFAGGWAVLGSALFFALLSLYWFICIYSLYDKLRNETVGRPYA